MHGIDVEFVINCFERNIEEVTAPGWLTRAVEQHHHQFTLRTLLVNNVTDRAEAARLADACVFRGEVDRWFWVADFFDEGLRMTGLRRRDFGSFLHWSDCCLAALALPGPDWLCYADVDLFLDDNSDDWVARGVGILQRDPQLLVANPVWRNQGAPPAVVEADAVANDHFVGYGFADQVFLVRRSALTASLLRRWLPLWLDVPVTMRWAMAHEGLFFEQIVDGFMRRRRLLRATLTTRSFEPVPMNTYDPVTFRERLGRFLFSRSILLLNRGRRTFPNLFSRPRLRTTGLLDPGYPTAGRESGRI